MLRASSSQILAAIGEATVKIGLNAADIGASSSGPLLFRVRYLALAGLLDALPGVDGKALAKLLSLKRNAPDELERVVKATTWWRGEWVQDVAEAVRLAPPDPEAKPGVVAGVDGGHLKAFIERIERVEEERASLKADIKEIYAEAAGSGYDKTIMGRLIQIRRKDPVKRMEEDEILDLYMSAVGD